MAGDTLWPNVLVSFDPQGTNGAALSQTDNRGNVFGVQGGSPVFSSTWSAVGGISAYFNGSARAQCANIAGLNFGSNDFEVNLWVYQTSRSGAVPGCLLGFGQDSPAQGWRLYIGTNGAVVFQGHTGSSLGTGAGVVPLNTETHICVTRVSGTMTIWVNGVSQATGAFSGLVSYSGVFQLAGTIGPYWLYTGYMDRLEILSGAVRHTGAFTPEKSAFMPYAGQVSGVIRDSSGAVCSRTVRAYRRDTGAAAGSATSDPGTGAYTINSPTVDEVTVIALDNATSGTYYNDQAIRAIPA